MSNPKRLADWLYQETLAQIVDFEFDESVTHVFADMINRSESATAHLQRLRQIGFQTAHQWFQCFNFASFLAIK